MSPLVKKEIRLLLPAWFAAMLLVIVPAWFIAPSHIGVHDDGAYMVFSFMFGIILLAISPFGQEFSFNTFALLLAQPISRRRLWLTKIIVLVVALVTVSIALWLSWACRAYAIQTQHALLDFMGISGWWAVAVFVGGLWTTLLFRQVTAAFWITLISPLVLAVLVEVLLENFVSNAARYATACFILTDLFYVIAGFFWARRLFLRAQDVQWTGGTIALPETRGASSFLAGSAEKRFWRPNTALFWKELQLYNISLLCACVLLGLHIVVIFLRIFCSNFHRNSLADTALGFVWILWLAMPLIIGCITVAEERKLGVMEGQLCLPVSRRFQFTLKFLLAMFLGTLFGGVMPLLLEYIASGCGVPGSMFEGGSHTNNEFGSGLVWFQIFIATWAGGLSLVCFFASTLAKNFLQALSIAIVTGIVCALLISAIGFVSFHHTIFFGITPWHSVLPFLIAIPVFAATLLWLAWLNFNYFHESWHLWQRNILGMTGALVFIVVSSVAIYNRTWEVFEPAEPPHGPARFSLSAPPKLQSDVNGNLLVRLPDSRAWFDSLHYSDFENESTWWQKLWWNLAPPLPKSDGPRQFIAGSNWVSTTAMRVDWWPTEGATNIHLVGYLDTVGVKGDGTLWISAEAKPVVWTGAKMIRFGEGTNWQQVVRMYYFHFLLLKTDGTLWRWDRGTNDYNLNQWQTNWPSVRAFKLQQIGTNSDWKEILNSSRLAKEADGSVWSVSQNWKTGKDELKHETNLDQIVFQTYSLGWNEMGYVGKDGTLWARTLWENGKEVSSGFLQIGGETNWVSVTVNQRWMVALKSDGSLWKWDLWKRDGPLENSTAELAKIPPTRLGIHNDWVALGNTWGGVVSMAADGSLWLWPGANYNEWALLKAPKQPAFLSNVFGNAN